MQADAIVHVIDDDDEVRRSLGFLLGAAGFRPALYESAIAFLDVLPGDRPGCVVTDVQMPQMTGIDLLQRLRERGASLPVIVMTGHGDLSMAVEAMRAGALDFLEKPFDDETLLASVHLAVGADGAQARHRAEESEFRRRLHTLSERERDLFEHLVAGQPGKVIAQSLGVSPREVEIDRASVMSKMNAPTLSKLVRMAMIVGVSEDGEP